MQGAGWSAHATEPLAPSFQLAQAQQTTPSPPQPNVEMIRAFYELTALKEELKVLRNRLEEMYFKQGNDSRRQEDFFQDIDRRMSVMEQMGRDLETRLGALESQSILAPVAPTGGGIAQQDVAGSSNSPGVIDETAAVINDTPNNTSPPLTPTPPETVETVIVSEPTVVGTTGRSTSSVSLNEQDAYDSAFGALKVSRYEDAITEFQGLLTTWPESDLADDALYWMSEAHYVTRKFEAALNGFRSLVERYPDSPRVPEAMLKVGYIQYDIGAYAQAANTFEELLARFPGHQVTVSAEIRLRRIKQTIN